MTASADTLEDLIVRREGAAGRITVNRPKALNSLTLDMVHSFTRALAGWKNDDTVGVIVIDGAGTRGLCAGGDIRALLDSGSRNDGMAETFWRDEYKLNAAIGSYPKPVVAFMDGIVMGGGVGISAHASCRVVTEKTMLAMPEVGIGLLPDVGGTWLLSRAPGELGIYLALTGSRIGGADAILAGLADYFVQSERLPELAKALGQATGGDVEAVVKSFAVDPGPAPLAEKAAAIDVMFGHDTVEQILETARTSGDDWAVKTAAEVGAKSPTSLKVTLAALRGASTLDSLEDCLTVEFRIISRMFDAPDFREGVRAAVIDKDQSPRWQPATLSEVSEAAVSAHFAPLGPRELGLIPA
ncbi:MAG TPA: enoyl-CoA hydratase/isomerase family protein [Skermanella sp.]|jgi:enoyl-CoA hydratase|nr:enoyl-CoA hydratase/isomerase family protein [Skermanella sp.]